MSCCLTVSVFPNNLDDTTVPWSMFRPICRVLVIAPEPKEIMGLDGVRGLEHGWAGTLASECLNHTAVRGRNADPLNNHRLLNPPIQWLHEKRFLHYQL